MTNARGEFEQHISTIQQYTVLGLSEADTRSHLIDPLLRILGFSDVRHLRREVMIPATPHPLQDLSYLRRCLQVRIGSTLEDKLSEPNKMGYRELLSVGSIIA